MHEFYDSPVRCLAYGAVYENVDGDGWPGMCPRRYLSPHDEDFMRLVAESLDEMDAVESPTRAQYEAPIQKARAVRDWRDSAQGSAANSR